MAAIIIGIGVVVLHAFATAVVWFELRSQDKKSKERIERATRLVQEAITMLRGDLVREGVIASERSRLSPCSSEARPSDEEEPSVEVPVLLEPEILARIEVLAEAQGMNRDEMLRQMARESADAARDPSIVRQMREDFVWEKIEEGEREGSDIRRRREVFGKQEGEGDGGDEKG